MSCESKDYQKLRAGILQIGDRIDRVENMMIKGMPDINLCINGAEIWIELKSPKEPARSKTKLLTGNNNHPLSQDQMNWFKRQIQAGGKAFILIGTDKRFLLIGGEHADYVNDLTVSELSEIAIWQTTKPVTGKEKWKQLRTLLQRK